jgi:hypothetical protein
MDTKPPKRMQFIPKTPKNCRKAHAFNRKTAETALVFVQNKPKVKSHRIDLTPVRTSTYVQMDNWLNAKNKPNQTQFKANSKPIQTQRQKRS